MTENKKQGRNEHSLIRLAKKAREGLSKNDLEVYLDSDSEPVPPRSMILKTFMAFSEDLNYIKSQNIDVSQVGFVTYDVYKRLAGNKEDANIWVSDSIEHIILGADPEFLIFDDEDYIIAANDLMEKDGIIGSDGAMAEIRPFPAIMPEDLVDNIKTIFTDKELTAPINPFVWKSGCYFSDQNRDYPVGGHIHIGNPAVIESKPIEHRSRFFVALNRILDEMIAIPMIKMDGEFEGSRRRTMCNMGNYGFFGDWRDCNGRLEFRTLSGRWLCHPTLAEAVIGTTKTVVEEFYKMVESQDFNMEYVLPNNFELYYTNGKYDNPDLWKHNFSLWGDIKVLKDLGCTIPSGKIATLLNKSDDSLITDDILKDYYNRFKSMSSYSKNCEYVDKLFDILKHVKKEHIDNCGCIQQSWIEGKKFFIE